LEAAWSRFGGLKDDLEGIVGEAEAEDVGEIGGVVGEVFAVGFLFGKGFCSSFC
jgi:hypothetical protein